MKFSKTLDKNQNNSTIKIKQTTKLTIADQEPSSVSLAA